MSRERESRATDGSVERRAEGAYEHLVDLCEDILGARPAPDAPPAELVAAIRGVWEALERVN